jgi:hypothetical protein
MDLEGFDSKYASGLPSALGLIPYAYDPAPDELDHLTMRIFCMTRQQEVDLEEIKRPFHGVAS